MKLNWRRHDRQGFSVGAGAARACVLAALLLGGVAACEQVASPELTRAENAAASGGIGGQVLNLAGTPVAGARVTAAGVEVATDAVGRFHITGLAVTNRLAVTVEADGYDATTAIYEVRPGVELRRPIRVQRLAAPVVISAGAGGSVPIAGGGEVRIPANAFAGLSPEEPVSIRATYIDTEDPAQFATAPGDFTAVTASGERAVLESFGMLSVAATDGQGQPVELAAGQQATIRFPLRGGNGAAVRGLWTFDPQQGVWVEEGTATVTPTSIDATVTSLAPRRNVDDRIRPVCIAVRVLRSDKVTPLPNHFVLATGVSYAGASQGWTDGQGLVFLQVQPAAQVLVDVGPQQQQVATPPPGTQGCPLVATFAL